MGFYTTALSSIASGAKEEHYPPRREKTHVSAVKPSGEDVPPAKNRVWDFSEPTPTCTRQSTSQVLELHREKRPTPTTIVSGVRYYGYRYLHPELGWINRDMIGERGGLNVYAFSYNNAVGLFDLFGQLTCSISESTDVPNDEFKPFLDGSLPAATTQVTWDIPYRGRWCGLLWKWKIYYTKQPTCVATIRYRLSPTALGGGRTKPIRGHEQAHVHIAEKYLTLLDDTVRSFSSCVCKPCFDAQWNYLTELETYYTTFIDYENKQFDCADYFVPIEPGNPRDQKCKEAGKLLNDLNAKAPQIQSLYHQMVNKCK